MALRVQKYGGTSVADIQRISRVADRLAKAHDAGDQVVVVLSAMAGVTDNLISLARQA
ncbi:MAG: aspartate kinase, partial [Desulfobacteraceae bacterium]|nr:aspartate kinase [Desulfobacteraceae bacterium]